MDLNKAFGSAFVFSRGSNSVNLLQLGTNGTDGTINETQAPVSPPKKTYQKPRQYKIPPEVYVLHVQIGRDDCHLLCMFLLVFSISFILSSRK